MSGITKLHFSYINSHEPSFPILIYRLRQSRHQTSQKIVLICLCRPHGGKHQLRQSRRNMSSHLPLILGSLNRTRVSKLIPSFPCLCHGVAWAKACSSWASFSEDSDVVCRILPYRGGLSGSAWDCRRECRVSAVVDDIQGAGHLENRL